MRSMHDQQWKSRMLKLSACFYTSLCGCPLSPENDSRKRQDLTERVRLSPDFQDLTEQDLKNRT